MDNKQQRKLITDTKEGSMISAYVIIEDGRTLGRVNVRYTDSRVTVDLWDWSIERIDPYEITLQQSSASGYNSDILQAAMSDLTFNRTKILNHGEQNEDGCTFDDWKHQLNDMGYSVFQAI